MSSRYDFYARTSKGNIIKTIQDIISTMKCRGCLPLSPAGIFIKQMNNSESVWMGINLYRENFSEYKCTRNFLISINFSHAQQLLKNVKKKDSMEIIIERGTEYIIFKVKSTTEDGQPQIATHRFKFKVEENDPCDIDLPTDDDYNYPITVGSKRFGSGIKKLLTSSKTICVTIQKCNYLSFGVDASGAYGSDLDFGELQTDDEDSDEDTLIFDPDDLGEMTIEEFHEYFPPSINSVYRASFYTRLFQDIIKVPGLCSQLAFYAPRTEESPMMIKLAICQGAVTLGDMKILIKDVDRLLVEEQERKNMEEKTLTVKEDKTTRTRRGRKSS